MLECRGMGRIAGPFGAVTLAQVLLFFAAVGVCRGATTARQASLDEWRAITAPAAELKRAVILCGEGAEGIAPKIQV